MGIHKAFAIDVIKYKEDGSVEKYKARLVVLGNQQNFGSAAAGDVAAPVTRFTTARILLAVANSRGWESSNGCGYSILEC